MKDGSLQMDFGADEFHPRKSIAVGRKPGCLEQSFDGGDPAIYEDFPAVDPTRAQQAEYTGVFGSDEIEPAYRVSAQDGDLTLTRLKRKPDPLLHLVASKVLVVQTLEPAPQLFRRRTVRRSRCIQPGRMHHLF